MVNNLANFCMVTLTHLLESYGHIALFFWLHWKASEFPIPGETAVFSWCRHGESRRLYFSSGEVRRSIRLWALNPTAYRQLAPLGGIVGILFLVLGAAPQYGRNRAVPPPPLGMETSGGNHRHAGSRGCR